MAPLDSRWAPSRYHKELQRAIAFCAYINILRSGVRKKQTQESILERLYHKGDVDEHNQVTQAPLVEQAVAGQGQFRGLCDSHSYICIDGASGERHEQVRLVVQDCLTRTASLRFVLNESFTRTSLSLAKLSDAQKLVSGRTLRAGAHVAHRNGQRAYELAKDFLDDNMELPPDKTLEDYDTYILTMMWKEHKQQELLARGEALSTPMELGSKPNDWIFEGWFAFRLYGPVGDDTMVEYRTDAFADPPADNMDMGAEGASADDQMFGNASQAVKTEGMAMLSRLDETTGGGVNGNNNNMWNRKRAAIPLPRGPFGMHVSEEERRLAIATIQQRVQTRQRLIQDEIVSLQKRAECWTKQLEMELQIATAEATRSGQDVTTTNAWQAFRQRQDELRGLWQQVEQKHHWLQQHDVEEHQVVHDYLSAVTNKRFKLTTVSTTTAVASVEDSTTNGHVSMGATNTSL